MTARGIVIIGGGGHALVVAEAGHLAGLQFAGYLDDDENAVLAGFLIRGRSAPVRLGPLELGSGGALRGSSTYRWILGLGDLQLRRAVLEQFSAAGSIGPADCPCVIHPRASVSPTARLGAGVFVGPGAIVHTNAVVGDHAIINSGAIVEHECIIGSNAHIAPGAALGGRVHVGKDSLIGIGSRVLPNMRIGDVATIGGGAVIVTDVGPCETVVGVPGRVLRRV